jgi:GNAT superfamily N-acetyltransferase
VSTVRFERSDPERPPASDLIAAMRVELNDVYETFSRLDNPPLSPHELRAPGGAYVVGYEGTKAVVGGGVRRLTDGVAEIKRMYVRPDARSRGIARALLGALEAAARSLGYEAVRLDTGPKQLHALALYRSAGYADVAPYNDNPFACFWGEKRLDPVTAATGQNVQTSTTWPDSGRAPRPS